MPFALTRRSFVGAAALASSLRLSAQTPSTRWALLADTHIPADPENQYRGFRPYKNLETVVPQVIKYAPDGVVIDGDLARLEGLTGDYQNLRSLLLPLTEKFPTAMSLGNHDHRQNFRTAFSEHPGRSAQLSGKHALVIERPPVRIVILDSLLLPNVTPGLLGKQQRTWLDQFLKSADATPTALFVHHTLDDTDGALLDADRFLQLVKPHRQVKAVFYGHSHAWSADVLDGIHLVNIPAVGYNFNDREPVGWVEAVFKSRGVDLTLRAFGGSTAQNGKTISLDWRG
jgi:3',5'-cyclic AMP phosphodiesterase CpdA